MKKLVFIVGSPLSYEVPVFYNGVIRDVQSYYNFYTSPTGGAFFQNEIIYLENPTWSKLKSYLENNTAEFVTFVFSGHGATGEYSQNTFLNINSYESVALIDILLKISAKKISVVTDSCRSYFDDRQYNLMGDLEATRKNAMNFPSYLNLQQARRIFDNSLRQKSDGIQLFYSCSAGEKSTITSGGSHYSQSLLGAIRKWSLKIEPHSILFGLGADHFSRNEIRNLSKRQNPRMYHNHDNSNFPFALRYGTELQRF